LLPCRDASHFRLAEAIGWHWNPVQADVKRT
jgi:hypothetical protein